MRIKKVTVDDIISSVNFDSFFSEYAKYSTLKYDYKASIDLYKALESKGALDIVASYSGCMLVGLVSIVTTVMPHYDVVSSTVESQFILKGYRKYGTWNKMISIAKDIALDKGSEYLFMSVDINSPLNRIVNRSGFDITHRVYRKSLK